MSMNTLKLSNVTFSAELEKHRSKVAGVFAMIDPVVSRLATLNPLWIFEAQSRYNVQDGFLASEFIVKLDGESLGTIGTSYMGQKGTVICISNDRIGKNRQRSSSYRTSDADKAVLMAKKMFGKMNPAERLQKAKEAAERVVSRASWNKERERNQHQSILKNEMLAWVENKGYQMFIEFIEKEALLSTKKLVLQAEEKVQLLDTEMKTIEKVQEDFSNNKTALVVKDAGKYLVKVGDNAQLYDDNSLPLDIRMKVGMLKLVQDEEYLTDIGCKVTSEIFVLLVDDLTNVSEGE
jgi:hypothetical protein